jgi:hypothetical protein
MATVNVKQMVQKQEVKLWFLRSHNYCSCEKLDPHLHRLSVIEIDI